MGKGVRSGYTGRMRSGFFDGARWVPAGCAEWRKRAVASGGALLCRAAGLSGWLLAGMLSSGLAAAAEADAPPALREWVPWVLRDEAAGNSPRDAADGSKRQAVWPGELQLEADAAGGRFRMMVKVYDEAWLDLPGNGDVWPREVTLGGTPVAVVARDGIPAVRLAAGQHTLGGIFAWPSGMPEKVQVPPGIGILRLSVEGKAVEVPGWDADGSLWLKRTRAEAADRDLLTLKVYRVIEDGIPMWLRTEIELSVSGKSREEELGYALPEGWQPSAVTAPLPCALDRDGRLRVQVRAGKWQIGIDAFRAQQDGSIRHAAGRKPLAERELIAFQADPSLRVLELRGLVSVDVAQTTMPERWRRLPLWLWDTGQPFTLEEKMRGMGEQRPPGLRFEREFWLDEDGRGFTWRDRLSGTGQNTWRLDAAPGQELGSVKIDGEGQLITKHPQSGASGVEVRKRDLNLTATGRAEFAGSVHATGWQANAESLEATLHLPPGWRLLAVFGPEWSQGDWLTSWSLLDVFLVLMLGLAVQRLHGVVAAVVAVAALVLLWKEPGAPRWSWGVLLALSALLRVVPVGRAAAVLRGWFGLAVLAFAVVTVPFVSRQLTGMLHPQVETIRAESAFLPTASVMMAETSVRRAMEDDVVQTRAVQQQAVKSNLLYDSKAKIQTGPAIPQWDWRTVNFGWRGPVTPEQRVRMVLLPVLPQRLLTLARILLLLGLAYLLLRPRRGGRAVPPPVLPPASAAATLLAVLLLTAGVGTVPAQEGQGNALIPDKVPGMALLSELKAELLKVPDAFPGAAEIPAMKLRLDDRVLTMEAVVHAAADCSVPLPGQLAAWSPQEITVDGQAAPAVSRHDGFLRVAVTAGVHRVTVRGWIPPGSEWQLTYALKPRALEIEAPGWTVTGIRPDGVPEGQVFFARQQADPTGEAAYDRRDFEAAVAVERRLELGLVWQVRSRVIRLSGEGKAISFRLPLLSGERVLTSGITPMGDQLEVRLGAGDREFGWESEIPVQESVVLRADPAGRWVERWFLETSPVWNVALSGLAPVFSRGSSELVPAWFPWPGESVTLNVSRPEAVTGETTTVRRVRQETGVGRQRRTTTLTLDLEASIGRDFGVSLESGAEIAGLTLNGESVPVRRDGDGVIIPVRPGSQEVVLKWHRGAELGTMVGTDRVGLPVESSNVTQRLSLPEDRWILWVRGPLIGPAIRFWAVLAGAVLFGVVLGGLPFSPFTRLQWALLLTGLTQVPLVAGGGLVLWFFWLGWRGSPRGMRPGSHGFNASQVLLGLGLLPVIVVVAMVLYNGLLGKPTMFLLGAGSYRTTLQWYQARGGVQLPGPEAISVSIWVYRGIMLAWSVWLALTLLRMAKWAWQQYSAGGLWAGPKPAAGAAAESGAPEPVAAIEESGTGG